MNIHLGAYSDELFALVVHYGGKIHQLPTMITSRLLLQVIYWSLIRAGLLNPPQKIRVCKSRAQSQNNRLKDTKM